MPTIVDPLPLPSNAEVMSSITVDIFSLANWKKHWRAGEPYPGYREFTAWDGRPLTRADVFQKFCEGDEVGILATLKWGFPRGAQRQAHGAFNRVIWAAGAFAEKLAEARRNPGLAASEIIRGLNEPGIGASTTSKIAYFAGLRSSEGPCLIYDQMVRRAIRRLDDPEYSHLRAKLRRRNGDLTPSAQAETYGAYVTATHRAAKRLNVSSAQLELFLFRLGRAYTFSEPAGE
jgi:hypothetical protein